eukprot:284819509_3
MELSSLCWDPYSTLLSHRVLGRLTYNLAFKPSKCQLVASACFWAPYIGGANLYPPFKTTTVFSKLNPKKVLSIRKRLEKGITERVLRLMKIAQLSLFCTFALVTRTHEKNLYLTIYPSRCFSLHHWHSQKVRRWASFISLIRRITFCSSNSKTAFSASVDPSDLKRKRRDFCSWRFLLTETAATLLRSPSMSNSAAKCTTLLKFLQLNFIKNIPISLMAFRKTPYISCHLRAVFHEPSQKPFMARILLGTICMSSTYASAAGSVSLVYVKLSGCDEGRRFDIAKIVIRTRLTTQTQAGCLNKRSQSICFLIIQNNRSTFWTAKNINCSDYLDCRLAVPNHNPQQIKILYRYCQKWWNNHRANALEQKFKAFPKLTTILCEVPPSDKRQFSIHHAFGTTTCMAGIYSF